ncbi:RNase H domain-containing protein [Durusdinium trenchii]|uniref:RNase H domain-containing protein n=1 Tax=Durusdinium trenchii TaxID=1381693 RepID=A0ABP0IIE2_9DINO
MVSVDDAIHLSEKLLTQHRLVTVRDFLHGHRSCCASLRRGCSVIMIGRVLEVMDETIKLHCMSFTPWKGFAPQPDPEQTLVVIPRLRHRSFCVSVGRDIIIFGELNEATVTPALTFQEDVLLIHRSAFEEKLPLNALHMFSGSYCGWSRALAWIGQEFEDLSTGSQTFVDADPFVMSAWAKQHQQACYHGPTSCEAKWDPSEKIGICSLVSDVTILRRCQWCSNAFMTLSPPCVSWSRGGKMGGLDCSSGFAAFESVQLIELQQPVLVFFECADEMATHPHFVLLQTALKLIGYVPIWQQIVPLHQLTHNARTRWLSAWKRFDVPGSSFETTIIPRAPPLTQWHADANKFWLPEDIKQQLILSHEARSKYGDPQLLPPAKRARLNDGSITEVLAKRIPAFNEALPTLCCSYSKQHEIEALHLADKGIFASLLQDGEEFTFINPLMFVSLFGSTDKVVLPSDVSQAFHLLGNAIAQPHAVLGLAIGLISVSQVQANVLDIVQKSWHDRITAEIAVVHRQGDWIEVHKRESFLRQLDFRFLLLPNPSIKYVCLRTTLSFNGKTRETSIPCVSSLIQAIKQILLLEDFDPTELQCLSAQQQDMSEMTVEEALHASPSIRCQWGDTPFAVLERGDHPLPETVPPADNISPTVPFSAREDPVYTFVECKQQSFDDLRRHPAFQEALTFIEHITKVMKQSEDSKQPASLAWETPALLFPIVIDQFDPLGCAQSQIDLLWPGKYQIYLGPCKLKKVANGPLLLVRPAGHPSDALVVFVEISPSTFIHLKAVSKQLPAQSGVITPNGEHKFVTHNFRAIGAALHCFTGDIIVIEKSSSASVVAAGHHQTDRPAAQLHAGASFDQRVTFAVDTHGWAASDELQNAIAILRSVEPAFLQACGFMQWDTYLNEFEEGPFEELHFAPQGRTCLFLLVGSHWALITVDRQPCHMTKIAVAGLPQQLGQRAAFITCRLLDIAPHRVTLDFDFLQPVPHMCGWTLLFQLFTKAEILDHMPDASYFWNILTTEERRTINEMLIASQHQWTRANADPVLRGFAFQLRLDFFCQLALRGRDNDPVTTIQLDAVFPRGNPDTGATPSNQPGRPLSVRLPLIDSATQTAEADRIQQRLQACSSNPGWLFSDALDYHCELLRLNVPNAQFAPPARWIPEEKTIEFLNGLNCRAASFDRTVVPILWNDHWIRCDICRDGWDFNLIVRGPAALQPVSDQLAADVAFSVLCDEAVVHHSFIGTNPPQHLCGWTLLSHLYRNFGTLMPMPSPRLLNELRTSPSASRYVWIHEAAVRQWGDNIDPMLRSFASAGLLLHLGRVDQGRIPEQYLAGGAVTATSPATPAIDPLTVHDPWAKKPPPSRWEDLSLGKTHPFHDETGTQLDQLHRLQATGHNGGIVLATKQHLAELIKLGTKQTFVALLPQLDDASKAMLGVAAHGPFEVILQDKAAGQTYKRITHAIAIHGKFSFTLKDPAAEFHTSEIAELVLEYDSRLVQKSDFDQASSSPVAFFKGHIAKHCPAYKDQITVYGFRHNRHPSASKQDDQLQIILKAPKAARSHLLQISGVDSVLVRDYLEKGITPLDVTVIPKFWPINAKALRELSITAENVPGLAGALMTRRGLAVRAWSKEVAEVRKKLLPADPRLTSSNIHVVPRLVLDSSGWPPGASPADIVEAVNKAVGLPPVPTRTFRSAGVHVWQLGFESPPKVDNFTVKINGDIFQILLAPIAAPEKGSGKGKSNRKAANPKKNADPPAAAAPPGLSSFNSENKRLDVLEARFDSLQGQVTGIEKKQSSIEQKLDSKFEDIGNTLRQLVQLSAQRPHEKSGETPPPKYSKTA